MELLQSEEGAGVLVAGTVFVFMNENVHVSRNVRAQWFFGHLNKKIRLPPEPESVNCKEELHILSIYPQDPPPDWGPSTRHLYQYTVTTATNITFLSHNSKAVYCLDMSPSISGVDIQRGQVMIDEITNALRNSIQGVVRPFRIPGTNNSFEPEVYVTVIVHTPFFTTPAQQVLVQGWKVTNFNVEEFLLAIIKQLELLEDTIAKVSGIAHDQIESLRLKQAESERLVGGLFEEVSEKPIIPPTDVSMVGPDSGFINLLRYGMLALRLLPPTNLSNLVVVTDGVIALPDIHVLDSVLAQLRSNAVAVSFLHVGSQFHPHCCLGLIPYSELMQFISSATTGTYISSPLHPDKNKNINVYHEAFICWYFRKRNTVHDHTTPIPRHGDWNISNQSFYGNREPQLLIKKQCEDNLSASLNSVLCCRLHEGYMIKSINLRDNVLDVVLMLPWSNHIFIEYHVTSEWPENNLSTVRYTLSIKAPYEFLHDITCLMKKPFHSPYRQAVVSRFWGTLKTLSHTDLLLSHLDSFSSTNTAFIIPDSIKNGMPLFYLPSASLPPELSSSGSTCPQFAQFWRPIVLLEPGVWQKWFHTHRIGLILQPDRPLPNSLHTVSSASRIHMLQCRQAEAALYSCLKKITSFVLIENHSFIKIMNNNDGDQFSGWFYIIRVTSKPPCAVIHIAFLGGTPGILRHEVLESVKEEMRKLRIPQRTDNLRKYESHMDAQLRAEVECCTIIHKPLEKILIRYERMPGEFGTVVFPDGTQPVSAAKPLRPASTLITTLSRYLHHKRSIWDAHMPSASHNNTLPTMLTTLIRIRLQEGFHFAHCSAGIINMVLEVQMKTVGIGDGVDKFGKYQSCIIQYILFPPHMTSTSGKGSNSGDDAEEIEPEVRTKLITECWIEPQHGVVTNSPLNRLYMNNLYYHQIADMIWKIDAECISNLLTFDHLQLMCHNPQIVPPLAVDPSTLHHNPLENWPHAVALQDERIHNIPFAYNLMNLLPKCQQAELLSSMFIQDLDDWEVKPKHDSPNNLLMESLLMQFQELHHRELHLSDHESTQLLQLIMSRPRNIQQHPIPFPAGAVKFDHRKISDTESTDTCETVPAASDWARMISWAMHSTDVSSPGQGSPDDIKASKTSSKSFNFSRKQKPFVPKWRCFVKSMASTHCVLTFVPASFQDLKLLMLGSDPKMFKTIESEDNLYIIRNNAESNLSDISNKLSRKDGSNKSLTLSTRFLSDSEEDIVFNPVPTIKGSYKDIFGENDFPFRLRSSSWDPMKKNMDYSKVYPSRIRTSSVGSKMKQFQERNREIFGDSECSTKNSTPKSQLGSVLGAVTLPIYVFDCPLPNLVDALIFKSHLERHSFDIFQDKTITFSKVSPENVFSKSDLESTPDELDLHYHCKVLTQIFNKCFVMALFKSLHSNHRIHSFDVQTAVDECEETLLEVDITKYLRTVCGHLKNFHGSGCNKLTKSSFSSECVTKQLSSLHSLIKKRFNESLLVCFRPVQSNPDFYFCCSSESSRMGDLCLDLTGRGTDLDDHDILTLQSDLMDLGSNQNSIIEVWDRVAYENTPDDARTSLLSNMDSDSVSDFLDELGDDISPLFLHLVCTIRSSSDNSMTNVAVRILPTCLGELVSKEKSLGDDIDLSNAIVTLDMYCLTLPPPCPADLPINAESSNLQHSEICLNEDSKSNDRLQHLPLQQSRAITLFISQVEWSMQDEIAVFLLDVHPVTESTLSFVANHVINSTGRYTCKSNEVNLDFVFGPEHSLDKFIQEFSQTKIAGCCLNREGDYYYLMKDALPQHPIQQPTDHLKLSASSSAPNLLSSSRNDHDIAGRAVCRNEIWIKELNRQRSHLPNFWLILKIEEDRVSCYFHCRFLEIECDEVQRYREIHLKLLENIDVTCKTVNQTLLLHSLHDTRMCDPLLEPETSEDLWKPSHNMLNHSKLVEDGVDIESNRGSSDSMTKFLPGCFSCPVVWQTHFSLHPRLRTGPGKPGLSRAIQALRAVLNSFSVNNRSNMFVYQDSTGKNVFYLRLHESIRYNKNNSDEDNSLDTVSRSSSINSLNNKRNPSDDVFSKEIRPRLRSLGDSIDNVLARCGDFLTLKVHGISEAGAEVKNSLVQVLQNRLDDAVLEVVSVMLARNSMCKLTSDDVHFIQKVNSPPDSITQFSIPEFACKFLPALWFYLQQNLLQFLFIPKYTDSRYQFQDYSQPEGSKKRIGEASMYLYNQSPASGSKGISCLALALVDNKGNIIEDEDQPLSPIIEDPSSVQFNPDSLTHSVLMGNHGEETSYGPASLEARLWKQGRVNLDLLFTKIKSSIRYSLWDLTTEFHLLTMELLKEETSDSLKSVGLNDVYYSKMLPWLQFGNDLGAPAIKMHTIRLTSRHCISVTLKEVNNLVLLFENSTYIFCENKEKTGAHIYSDDEDISNSAKCFVVAVPTNSEHFDLKAQKGIQKFPSLQKTYLDGRMISISRKRYFVAVVTNVEVTVYVYNWSKDKVEHLIKLLSQLGSWLSARSNFLTGITAQKMGLFHNQPYMRKSSQMQNPEGVELETLLGFMTGSFSRKFISGTLHSLTQVLRDCEATWSSTISSDFVVDCVNKIFEIKSIDKKENQKNSCLMSHGVAPYIPLAQDSLDLFLQSSRIIHYCLTPLLFLPQWRFQSAATRDHSLRIESINQSLSGDCSYNSDEKWHQNLCVNFISEYKQYLQTLGFIPIQSAPSSPRKLTRSDKINKLLDEQKCYLQKSLLGGTLMFEIFLSQPFFHVKLHVLECSRLQGKPSSNLIPQIILSFLEESDKVKIMMHLHSFTYDYHLRCLHWYMTDQLSFLKTDYHITSFLDDFLKYYPKAPNYARSLVCNGEMCVQNLSTSGQQLYDYLLSHGKDYGMDVLRMVPCNVPLSEAVSVKSEYILVKHSSTSYVATKDAYDGKLADDFDVTLIVSHNGKEEDSSITITYYILLTSRRELYPKLELEWKLGKFCTVSTANPLNLMDANAAIMSESQESTDAALSKPSVESTHHLEIRQESVNYLGYYSSHEQLMQQLITQEALAAKNHVETMLTRGSTDCRVHLLWNKLLSSSNSSSMNALSYTELFELKKLAHIKSFSDIDPRLCPMLSQPISWYHGLLRMLSLKFPEKHKLFNSPDNNFQHLLLLHHRFIDGFVMLSIDQNSSIGELNVVFRQSPDPGSDVFEDIRGLIEGVVNACCFHLWLSILN